MTISEAIQEFLSARVGVVSASTLKINRQYLAPFDEQFGCRCVETITLNDLRLWRLGLVSRNARYDQLTAKRPSKRGGLSPFTVNLYLRMLRQLFRWLWQEERIPRNPAARLELVGEPDIPPKAISEEDLCRVIRAAHPSPRDLALIYFLAATGSRVGGLVGLRLEHLELDRARATVYEKGRGGAKARTVYLAPIAVELMRCWLLERPETTHDTVFVSNDAPHARLTRSGVYQVLKRLARTGECTGRFNPHSFRHRFAREMLLNGAPLAMVSQILGHSTIDVTVRYYGRFADHELQQTHARYLTCPRL